jgi:hypothetical protein
MRKLLLAIVIVLAALPAGSMHTGMQWTVRCELAFNLMPSANSYPVSFAILTWYGDSERPDEIKHLTRHEFLSIAHGLVESKANPNKEDLFAKYEVQDCQYFIDPIAKTTSFECSIVDDIWRLRYKTYPYRVKTPPEGSGWASSYDEMSWGQLDYLGKYGVRTRNDFFYGKNAFMLLKDMQNSDWVSEYAKQ